MNDFILNKENRVSRDDIQKQGYNIWGQEQIDQMILTPEARATVITKKAPNMIRIPIFSLDENGEKIPALDEKGNVKTNDLGEIIYVIKDYEEVQDGWIPIQEIVPASEIFNIDNGTGNISHDAVLFLTTTIWRYNTFCVYQQTTNNDYSIYLHKLRNDALGILNASKSFNGGTIQAIKTFINKTDSKQWLTQGDEEKKGGGIFGMFGVGKPKPKNEGAGNSKNAAFGGNMNFM